MVFVYHNRLDEPHYLPFRIALGTEDLSLDGSSREGDHREHVFVAQGSRNHIERIYVIGESRTTVCIDVSCHIFRNHAEGSHLTGLHRVAGLGKTVEMDNFAELGRVELTAKIA